MVGLVGASSSSRGAGEHRVAGVGLEPRRAVAARLLFLQPLGVAAQLLFDLVGRAFERDLRGRRAVRGFQHHAVGDGRDDVAGEIVLRAAAEGDVGADRPRIIFLGDLLDPADRMLFQRIPGFDLMVGDTNVH